MQHSFGGNLWCKKNEEEVVPTKKKYYLKKFGEKKGNLSTWQMFTGIYRVFKGK
jgi:hypothetical protein